MSTMYQSVPTDPATRAPAERLGKLGQEMGLWNHGFDFARFARQLFRDIDFRDRSMLEIGCGKGMLCLWAALHGASETVGLEPRAGGFYVPRKGHRAFRSRAQELPLPQ